MRTLFVTLVAMWVTGCSLVEAIQIAQTLRQLETEHRIERALQ